MASDDLEFRGLPYGGGVQTQEGQAFAAAADDGPPDTEVLSGDATADPEQAFVNLAADAGGDELDAELLAPTDFPDRPLTHGAPFGPGSNFVRLPHETEQGFMHRIATSVLERSGEMPDDLKIWALRVQAGL